MRSAPSRSAPPPRFSSGGVAAAVPVMPSDRVPNASPVAAPDAWYASPSFWKSKSGSVKKRKAVSAPWEAKPAPVAAPCCAKGIQPPFSAGHQVAKVGGRVLVQVGEAVAGVGDGVGARLEGAARRRGDGRRGAGGDGEREHRTGLGW